MQVHDTFLLRHPVSSRVPLGRVMNMLVVAAYNAWGTKADDLNQAKYKLALRVVEVIFC